MALGIASGGGAGYAPIAPGTAGSLVAVIGLWLIPFTTTGLLVALAVVTGVGVWASDRAERVLGRKDPGVIVVDEIVGMMVSVALLPRTPTVLVVAFLLFRVLDIWKPFPARASQDLAGGLGVMADDLVAGAYVLVLLVGARALTGLPA